MIASSTNDEERASLVCRSCGAAQRRASARFCVVCGSRLEHDYAPSSALRASYRFAPVRLLEDRASARGEAAHTSDLCASTALAFMIYSLVPYVGIIFSPGALLFGLAGLWRRGVRHRASVVALVGGALIFVFQVFLWWILYKIPEWSR